MLLNDQLAVQEMMRRLVSLNYQDQNATSIIEDYRAELREQRDQHARELAEMAKNAYWRIAHVKSVQSAASLMPQDHIVKVEIVYQRDMDEFCKVNGVDKTQLLDAVNHKRKEATGKNNVTFRAHPLLYSEYSEQGNREASESWKLETQREEQYLASRAKDRGMAYKPVPEPVMTVFNGRGK